MSSSRDKTFLQRWNAEHQSPRGFVGALYTLSACYFTLLVLNCTPWIWCVCRFKCILPASVIKQFLLASCWVGGSVFHWLTAWINFTMGTRGKEKQKQGREKKTPQDGWHCFLQWHWMYIKFSPKCYGKMGDGGGGGSWKTEKENMATWSKSARLQRSSKVSLNLSLFQTTISECLDK